jgi:hypothetical protein
MSARVRGYGFALATVLGLVVLLGWAGVWAWLHLDRLQKDFSAVESASFHLAEHVQEKMAELEQTVRSLDVRPDAAGLANFRRQASDMTLWLQTNRQSVSTVRQRGGGVNRRFTRLFSAFELGNARVIRPGPS